MLSNVPDLEELKKKYAEIAHLKREIEEKLALRPKIHGIRKPLGRSHMSMIFTNNAKNTLENSDSEPQYITTNRGMSLMTPRMFHRRMRLMKVSAERTQRIQEEFAKKRQETKMKNSVAKFRTQADGCDRVEIEGEVYGVAQDGRRLLPLTFQTGQFADFVEWNGWKFTREKRGGLVNTRKRYGENLAGEDDTNIRTKEVEQCRYFTRTGMYLFGQKRKGGRELRITEEEEKLPRREAVKLL